MSLTKTFKAQISMCLLSSFQPISSEHNLPNNLSPNLSTSGECRSTWHSKQWHYSCRSHIIHNSNTCHSAKPGKRFLQLELFSPSRGNTIRYELISLDLCCCSFLPDMVSTHQWQLFRFKCKKNNRKVFLCLLRERWDAKIRKQILGDICIPVRSLGILVKHWNTLQA